MSSRSSGVMNVLQLLGQFLGDLFVFAPAVDEILQAFRRFMMLELRQEIDQMMDAAVGLLRAGFEQIEKLFVVSKKFPDREHTICPSIAVCREE